MKIALIGTQAPFFDGTRDELLEDMGVDCVRLDDADREGWVDTVLRRMGLPLHPPQIDIFSGSA